MASFLVRAVVSATYKCKSRSETFNNKEDSFKTKEISFNESSQSASVNSDLGLSSSSFIKADISTSTAYSFRSTELDSTGLSSPTEHKASAAALGELKTKQSPIFQCKSLKAVDSNTFSLRSSEPHYTLNAKKSCTVDHTAVEALNMKTKNSSTKKKTQQQQIGKRPFLIDINRNNGTFNVNTIMTSNNAEKREHLYKILVIGELGTGKTSFIKRYVHQFFSQNYRATIGVDFALKVLHWDANTIVRLQLWDIAGQERFGNMTRVYYKEAVGAFIVFDVTRSGTFDCVSKWKDDLDSKVQLPDGSPIPCILLANKCDQEKQGMVTSTERMDDYVRENGFAGWFETSAKENINIDEAARALVHKILLNDKLISTSDLTDSERFNLNSSTDQNVTDTKSKCSC